VAARKGCGYGLAGLSLSHLIDTSTLLRASHSRHRSQRCLLDACLPRSALANDGNIAVTLPPQVKTQTNLSWGISGDARCAICNIGRADRRSRCSRCRDRHAVSRAAIAIVTVTARASYRIHRARISATARNATANKSARMSGIRAPSRVCGKIVLKARDLRRLAARTG
jgi:hypothetical protein